MATETSQVTDIKDVPNIVNNLIARVQALEKKFSDAPSGTKYVSTTSGGAVTDEITITNGLITSL